MTDDDDSFPDIIINNPPRSSQLHKYVKSMSHDLATSKSTLSYVVPVRKIPQNLFASQLGPLDNTQFPKHISEKTSDTTNTSENDRRQYATAQVKTEATLITRWSAFIKKQAILHDMSWVHYRFWHLSSTITSIILTSISGISTLGIGNFGLDCSSNSSSGLVALYIFGGVGIVGSCIMAVNQLMGIPELMQKHDMFCDDYTSMYYDILLNMALEGTECGVYTNRGEFMKHVKYGLDRLLDRAPPIMYTVRNRYKAENHNALRKGHRKYDQALAISDSNESLPEKISRANAGKTPMRRSRQYSISDLEAAYG